ncbi:MAG: Holliday junction resolvase RuvX [Pyrinomonadaceae bacterium]
MNETSQPLLKGPILALDLGEKRIGVAVADETLITITPLDPLNRSNWKQLVRDVADLVRQFDARTLVIGLPLRLDGSTGNAAEKVHQKAVNLGRTIQIPVYLQNESLTSIEARYELLSRGHSADEIPGLVDSEAARLILRDFLNTSERHLISTFSEKPE